ncbi:hypothetical protein ACL1B8_01345 [Corynebacterium striatum]
MDQEEPLHAITDASIDELLKHLATALPEQMKLDIAKSAFAASIRGTDFKNPENPFRNYPGNVRSEA